jgi:hypothetical protein
VAEAGEPDTLGRTKSGVQFKIIPGHHGGYISQMRECTALLVAVSELTHVLFIAIGQW